MFYSYVWTITKTDIENNLELNAKLVNKLNKLDKNTLLTLEQYLEGRTTIDIVASDKKPQVYHSNYEEDNRKFYMIEYPSTDIKNSFIIIIKDMTTTFDMIDRIFQNLFIFALIGLLFVVLYAVTLSRVLTIPISSFAKLIANTDINNLQTLDKKSMPQEFHPVVTSLNKLANKVKSHIMYQKELYIGITHELKTPMSVIKLKNDIMLKKPRQTEEYEDTMRINVKEIDKMTKMVSSVLEMGRQESVKFENEKNIVLDLFIQDIIKNFAFVAQRSNKIIFKNNTKNISIKIQPTMLSQIIQNFIQNAVKFSNTDATVLVLVRQDEKYIYIEVFNEGDSIDETKDYFAPFTRFGDKQGVGLGLYLSKNASDSLGSVIKLENRTDGIDGVVATLKIKKDKIGKYKFI